MWRVQRERAIISSPDQLRPYCTMIDTCKLPFLQISVDRMLRITRRSTDTAQARRSWRLSVKFSRVYRGRSLARTL